MIVQSKTIMKYSKKLNILYVEDDELLRNSTLKIFSTLFNTVETAQNGKDGFDKYLNYKNLTGEYYDVVITDINMPILNGIEMCQLITQENSLQALIFITAYNDSSYLQSAIDIGVNGFLSKPINHEQLKVLLYKTTKAISDSKEIEQFYNQVDKLNTELENQNIELKQKNHELKKSYRMLNTIVDKDQRSSQEKIEKDNKVQDVEEIYVRDQMRQFISEDLPEIEELFTEIDSSVIGVINSSDSIPDDTIDNIIRCFTQYASLLSFYTFFSELSQAMKEFAITLDESPLPDDPQKINDIFVLLESFLFVLNKWNKDLKDSDAAVSFFDASIISDMNTITMMWTMNDTVDNSEDDDIFF